MHEGSAGLFKTLSHDLIYYLVEIETAAPTWMADWASLVRDNITQQFLGSNRRWVCQHDGANCLHKSL
jgi:hypothetical protein